MLWSIDSCQTEYPLISITWPYRGLKCWPIEVEYLFEVIRWQITSFKWSQVLKFFFPMIHMNYVDVLNSACRILQCWSYYVKINSKDINTTPKDLKTERDCSHRQLFRPLWGSSVWRNNQRKLWWKISAHSDFKPWPRTLDTHRITPYHVSSGG